MDGTDVDLRGVRVLIVEDTPAILHGLARILADLHGATVLTAATEEQALGILDSSQIDVAVLDLILDTGSSLALARRLRHGGTPFLFLSGYGTADLLTDEFRSEILLNKPCDPGKLTGVLRSLVGREGNP